MRSPVYVWQDNEMQNAIMQFVPDQDSLEDIDYEQVWGVYHDRLRRSHEPYADWVRKHQTEDTQRRRLKDFIRGFQRTNERVNGRDLDMPARFSHREPGGRQLYRHKGMADPWDVAKMQNQARGMKRGSEWMAARANAMEEVLRRTGAHRVGEGLEMLGQMSLTFNVEEDAV